MQATRSERTDVHPTGNNRGLAQAYDIRDIAAKEAIELGRAETKDLSERLARAKAMQSLASVWSDASDRIRILRGRPLPGSRRPEPLVKKKKSQPLPPVTES